MPVRLTEAEGEVGELPRLARPKKRGKTRRGEERRSMLAWADQLSEGVGVRARRHHNYHHRRSNKITIIIIIIIVVVFVVIGLLEFGVLGVDAACLSLSLSLSLSRRRCFCSVLKELVA